MPKQIPTQSVSATAGRQGRLLKRAIGATGHLLLALVLVFGTPVTTAVHARSPYPFELETKQQGDEHVLIAKNRGPAPVSARVELVGKDNTTSDRVWPIHDVMPPEREVTLARIYGREPSLGYSFEIRSVHAIGDFTATHDPQARYRMPFEDGRTFAIGQAAGGPITTHTTPESHFAVDIPMPEGTAVLAARDGIVIDTEFGYTSGGTEESQLTRANFVRVLHADGTIASYVHLAPGGVSVSAGQRVRAGTRLGSSGSTGFSSGPHLHFAVTHLIKTDSGFQDVSIPLAFYVGDPPHVFEPEIGMRVKAEYGSSSQPYPLSAAEREALAAQVRPPVEGTAATAREGKPGEGERTRSAPSELHARLMTWRWWQWLALILALWLLVVLLIRGRSVAAAREAYVGPRESAPLSRRSRPAEETKFVKHDLSTTERLNVACGADDAKARLLMEHERRRSPSIDDDEAARRALERLTSRQR